MDGSTRILSEICLIIKQYW